MPPAASICIMSEVPERGRPETMVIMSSFWNRTVYLVRNPIELNTNFLIESTARRSW